jgi:hypothetical protein
MAYHREKNRSGLSWRILQLGPNEAEKTVDSGIADIGYETMSIRELLGSYRNFSGYFRIQLLLTDM